MTYQEWNNLISSYFFNEEMYEKEVYLYITKEDIINIGQEETDLNIESEIWEDFINAINSVHDELVDGNDIIKTLLRMYNNFIQSKNNIKEHFEYPPYVAYLILFILPITNDEQLNINSFYERVNLFLSQNKLPQLPHQTQNFNWNILWQDLENWSVCEKNLELGYFEIHEFGNKNWKYVSKPLSQSLIKQTSIKKLPGLFYKNNIPPKQNINEEKIIKLLLNNREQLDINPNLFEEIKNKSEIGNLFIKIIKRFYEKWNGQERYYSKKDIVSNITKPWTLSTIKLCMNIDFISENVQFFFRIYSSSEFPSDLLFEDKYKVEYEYNNWSKRINITKHELWTGDQNLIWEDKVNKWKAIWKKKDFILLIDGRNYSLNGFVESHTIESFEKLFLICNNTILENINHFLFEDFSCYLNPLNFDGLLGLNLFEVVKKLPKELLNHYDIEEYESDSITFSNLLKINKFDYLQDGIPGIEVPLIYANKFIALKYAKDNNIIELKKTDKTTNILQFPQKIIKGLNSEIIVKEKNEKKITEFRIIEPYYNSRYVKEIPIRNAWAEKTTIEDDYLWQGNDYMNMMINDSLYYQTQHHFMPELNPSVNRLSKLEFRNHVFYQSSKDIMLSYISSLGKLSFDKYFMIFEQIILNHKNIEKIDNIVYKKHLSLRYLERLGHLDIDYENQRIIVNKPQLILTPNSLFVGRVAILLGARSSELVNELIRKSKNEKIKVTIEDSIDSKTGLEYIIPQTIKLSVQGDTNENYGEKRLENICKTLNIEFKPKILMQPLLLITSAKIDNYERLLLNDEIIDYDWNRKVFNPTSLQFENSSYNFDKNLCLLKYHFTNFHIKYKLWKEEKCFKDHNCKHQGIDPEWGRYFILYKLKKDVLYLEDNSQSLAVPITVPLPKYINKALTLMSGYIPYPKKYNGITYEIYENQIPSLMHNIFSQLGQTIRQINSMEN